MEVGHVGTQHVRVLCPPGVATKKLEALQEEEFKQDVDTGSVLCDYSLSSLELERASQPQGSHARRYVSAGDGKRKINSRAGEFIMPKDLLPGEELIEGPQKKNGMNYVAADDSRMKNYGEKEISQR